MDNNLVTWIWARSTEAADLLDGLRRGHAYFGDITSFDGSLDLTTDSGHTMGTVVVTDRASVDVTVSLDGLEIGDRIDLVDGGVVSTTWTASAETFSAEVPVAVTADATQDQVVRLEVYSSVDREKALSNPVAFTRRVPTSGLPPERLGLDLAGIIGTDLVGLTLSQADVVAAPRGRALRLLGSAENGAIELDFAAVGPPSEVLLFGWAGSWTRSGTSVHVEGLEGVGGLLAFFEP